jgi:hypothetical protein
MRAPAVHRGDGSGRKESSWNLTKEFPTDKHGVPILDAASLDALKAWRHFNTIPGDLLAIVAALLVVAWALLRGRP